MRVNLLTQTTGFVNSSYGSIALALTIKPSCGLPGDFELPIDSTTLLRLLKQKTDLPSSVLKRFEGDLYSSSRAKLLGVELSEQVLTDVGYFIE